SINQDAMDWRQEVVRPPVLPTFASACYSRRKQPTQPAREKLPGCSFSDHRFVSRELLEVPPDKVASHREVEASPKGRLFEASKKTVGLSRFRALQASAPGRHERVHYAHPACPP